MGLRKRFGCGTDTWLSSGLLHEVYLSATDMAAVTTLTASLRESTQLIYQQVVGGLRRWGNRANGVECGSVVGFGTIFSKTSLQSSVDGATKDKQF